MRTLPPISQSTPQDKADHTKSRHDTWRLFAVQERSDAGAEYFDMARRLRADKHGGRDRIYGSSYRRMRGIFLRLG